MGTEDFPNIFRVFFFLSGFLFSIVPGSFPDFFRIVPDVSCFFFGFFYIFIFFSDFCVFRILRWPPATSWRRPGPGGGRKRTENGQKRFPKKIRKNPENVGEILRPHLHRPHLGLPDRCKSVWAARAAGNPYVGSGMDGDNADGNGYTKK